MSAQETGRLEITEQVDNDFRNLAQNFRDKRVEYLVEENYKILKLIERL